MTLNHCGVVDSEDGLLLFGDAEAIQQWRGTENEPTQLDHITSTLGQQQPGLIITIGQAVGVIWDLEGPGTTDVFRSESSETIVLIRSWLDDPDDDMKNILALNAIPAPLQDAFAEFEVRCGFLAILWPTESGECIYHIDPFGFVLSIRDMMTETSGMSLPVPNGHYRCFADTIVTDREEARRCHIIREA